MKQFSPETRKVLSELISTEHAGIVSVLHALSVEAEARSVDNEILEQPAKAKGYFRLSVNLSRLAEQSSALIEIRK